MLNNMAVEPWNKINILRPSASAVCRVTFNTRTARVSEAVVLHCGRVLKLLESHVLHTELRVLHELLYVLHNGFRQHKPFRAIKQVEQCINRLKEMKLQEALQDLQELCPNQIQRTVGVDVGHFDVPSQPMLEWFCLKLLGASSLLCRTLDQCTKAFSLTRQHLHLSEFIVLNLVLTSLLSRIWVFYRGILRTLVPVYQGVMDLLREVVQYQPMAFLTDYTLPGDLEAFLGAPRADLLNERSTAETFGMRKTAEPSLLYRLFEVGSKEQVEQEKEEEEERQMMLMLSSEEKGSNMDLGRSVSRRGSLCSRSSSLDIKAILQPANKQRTDEVVIKTEQPSASSLAVLAQKRMLLKKLKMASSIEDMVTHIEEMMRWCGRSKLHQERHYLAFTLLKCQRITALKHEGVSVQKKLRRLRLGVQHVMLKGTSLPRSSHILQRRTKYYFRTRFTTRLRRCGKVRMRTKVVRDLFNVTVKSSRKCRKVPHLHKAGSDVTYSEKESKMETETSLLKSSSVRNDEIDNIFASFGL